MEVYVNILCCEQRKNIKHCYSLRHKRNPYDPFEVGAWVTPVIREDDEKRGNNYGNQYSQQSDYHVGLSQVPGEIRPTVQFNELHAEQMG